MEGSSESSNGGEKPSGSRSKTQIPAATRAQRNHAEKQRRDRLNGYISELATLVPMVSNASKPLDKVSILRLAAAQMRLNFSCLNPKRFNSKPVTLPPSVISYLDVIEKTIGGFVLVTTFSGCIVFCSKSIEDYVGYQNIDVIGNSVYSYIHNGDVNYLEKKVNSVINKQKKGSKKRTKVIKAHMQQRPLPRSNDVRYRKMIFKISIHLNDMGQGSSGNGQPHSSSKIKKSGRTKDFGYSAVVLMFIEPVRLEPEIDVTYIESHQDAYFTMHGLKGEIFYADQRISSITGYMPHDVQGKSAYQYICESDVQIAHFAQSAMFTSSDGTGVIVYRLKIHDGQFIYLQSSGQIAYKDSSSEISHFVCFNKLLSDDEGSQELKKFQQRFAPQIMAAKMMQRKGNASANQIDISDLAYEQAVAVMKSMNSPSTSESILTAKQSTAFQSSKIASLPSISNRKSSDSFVLSPNNVIGSQSSHSSESHSVTSPVSEGRYSSTASEYKKISPCTKLDQNLKDSLHFSSVKQNLINTDHFSFTPCSNDVAKNITSEKIFNSSIHDIKALNHVPVTNKLLTENNVDINGSVQQNNSFINSKLYNKRMHSKNAYSSSPNNIITNGNLERINCNPINSALSESIVENDVSFDLDSALKSSDSIYAENFLMDSQHNAKYEGHPVDQFNVQNDDFAHTQDTVQFAMANTSSSVPLVNQQMKLDNKSSHSSDLSSFSGVCKSFASNLTRIPNGLPVNFSLSDTVDFSHHINSFPDHDNYLLNNVNCNNGAIQNVYNSLPVLDAKSAYQNGTNIYATELTEEVPLNFPPHNSLCSIKVTDDQNFGNDDASWGMCNDELKSTLITYQNGSSNITATYSGQTTDQMDWNGTDFLLDNPENVESELNNDLFCELDLFFKNFSEIPLDSQISGTNLQFSIANGSYLQNNISSSQAKTRYHQ